MPGEIGSKTVGRREARSFADKDEAKAGSQMKANRIPNGYAPLLDQGERSDSPPGTEQPRKKLCEQRDGIALDSQRGEAIRNDNGKITGAALKLRNGVGVESSSKDRLTQIASTIGGVGLKLQNRNRGFSKNGQFRR
jgi:hypothetical protein